MTPFKMITARFTLNKRVTASPFEPSEDVAGFRLGTSVYGHMVLPLPLRYHPPAKSLSLSLSLSLPPLLQPKEEVIMSGMIRTAGIVRATLLSGLLKIAEVSGEPTAQTSILSSASPLLSMISSPIKACEILTQTDVGFVCAFVSFYGCVLFCPVLLQTTFCGVGFSLHNNCHFISCTL